jgi:hypothetical protein
MKPYVTAAARHFVLYKLSIRELNAEPAPGGVLVDEDTTLIVRARTKDSSQGGWLMNAKHEEIIDPSTFYALVDLEDPDAPQVWIMPAEVVADACRRSHRAWHSTPKARGTGPKVETNLRRIYPHYDPDRYPGLNLPEGWMDPYQEAWESLTPTPS